MFYEAARKEKITPEIAAKSVFGDYLNGCVSAVFSGVGKENVLCVSGLEFYVPIFWKANSNKPASVMNAKSRPPAKPVVLTYLYR